MLAQPETSFPGEPFPRATGVMWFGFTQLLTGAWGGQQSCDIPALAPSALMARDAVSVNVEPMVDTALQAWTHGIVKV